MEKNGFNPRRVTTAIVLLAVLFLPFHLHFFTPTAQLTQECSCQHGVRTQAGLGPAPTDWAPNFQASFVDIYEPQVFSWFSIHFHAIRAPPSLYSL